MMFVVGCRTLRSGRCGCAGVEVLPGISVFIQQPFPFCPVGRGGEPCDADERCVGVGAREAHSGEKGAGEVHIDESCCHGFSVFKFHDAKKPFFVVTLRHPRDYFR